MAKKENRHAVGLRAMHSLSVLLGLLVLGDGELVPFADDCGRLIE